MTRLYVKFQSFEISSKLPNVRQKPGFFKTFGLEAYEKHRF